MHRRGDAANEGLLDAVAIAVIVTDPSGIVTDWNESAHRLFGWNATEALGRRITELNVPADSTDDAAALMASVVAGAEWSGEIECHRIDGSSVWTHTTLTPLIADDEVIGIVGSSVDVSQHRSSAIR